MLDFGWIEFSILQLTELGTAKCFGRKGSPTDRPTALRVIVAVGVEAGGKEGQSEPAFEEIAFRKGD